MMTNFKIDLLTQGKKLTKYFYNFLRKAKTSYDFHAGLRKKLRKNEAILVHQMGKVGSSTIVASLEALNLNTPIYHTHTLNPQYIESRLIQLKAEGRKLKTGSHMITSQYLSKVIAKGLNGRSWKVITLVREPIIRNISDYFQNIDNYLPNFIDRYKEGSLKIDEITNNFLENYRHDRPLYWFNQEIKEVFNIDVLSVDFPKQKGYKIFANEHLNLLVIRLEDLNRCYADAFKEFLGIEQFKLTAANVAAGKQYDIAYKEIKDTIELPHWYLEKMYSSQYVRHFYTHEEIENFRLKWSR
ncbi:MAG: putative capsular polysaccharide synthesis family protein [Aphanothece sp. CMT-3BRIN-NPC111]|jgi:hypothetical protein|nr:putative capsular polysaccharide synthesis family protein [Aphanothece sp. CMT-3BRIN-NPC111]